jgi:hypothetical protein
MEAMSVNRSGWNGTAGPRKLPIVSGIVLTGVLLAAITLVLAALVPAAARADACPNAAERFGFSANLPDCRAYELVTPAIKGDNSLITEIYGFSDGEHVTMTSILPFPGAANGEPQPVLSSRTASEWVTTPLSPPQGPGELDNLGSEDTGSIPLRASFTSNFSAAFINTPFASDSLDQNLATDVYRVLTPSGTSSLASLPDSGPTTESVYHPAGVSVGDLPGSFIAGNSADGSHVFFTTLGRLPTAPGTPADTHISGNETYERYAGHTYLVGILPDGSVAPCGAEVGGGGDTGPNYYSYLKYGAVSSDGSNVVFHTYGDGEDGGPQCPDNFHENPGMGALYLREGNGTSEARTIQLQGLFFLARTADGSKILSTGGAGGNAEGEPLYEYDTATGQETTVGYGSLLAYSADGSRVYFLTDTQELKVYDHGVTRTIPGAGAGYVGRMYSESKATEPGLSNLPLTVPDGSKFLFLDRANLTTYGDNGHSEAYIYDLNNGSVTCVSCNPSGAPPLADVNFYDPPKLSAFFPQTASLLSEDGSRVFFETREGLVPQDTNGLSDVYEWESGHVYLLSSGQGGVPGQEAENSTTNDEAFGVVGSRLVGASSSGDDVFIVTDQRLLPQDLENAEQVYDVRVNGGFPYTTPVYGCDSGQCQGPQTPAPVFSPPPSATFVGLGNPVRDETAPAAKPKPKGAKPKPKIKRAKRSKRVRRDKGTKANRNGKGRA